MRSNEVFPDEPPRDPSGWSWRLQRVVSLEDHLSAAHYAGEQISTAWCSRFIGLPALTKFIVQVSTNEREIPRAIRALDPNARIYAPEAILNRQRIIVGVGLVLVRIDRLCGTQEHPTTTNRSLVIETDWGKVIAHKVGGPNELGDLS